MNIFTIFLLLINLLFIPYYSAININTNYFLPTIFFITNIQLLIISLLYICRILNKNYIRYIYISILSIFYIFLTICTIPFFSDSNFITNEDILAVLQTHPHEAMDYMFQNVSIYFYLYILISIFSVYLTYKLLFIKTKYNQKRFIFYYLIIFLCSIILISLNIKNQLTKPFYESIPKIKSYYAFSKNIKQRKLPINKKQYNKEKGIYVIVIGESQNRTRMSAYGYNKNTTPFLNYYRNNPIQKNGEWIFFDNAYSCHTHTIQTLTYALTEKNNNSNTKKLEDSYSIIEIAKSYGYKTWWISNQKQMGYNNEPISNIAMLSDIHIRTNKSFTSQSPYDEIILKYLPSLKNESSNSLLIFIHLNGNHLSYQNRYPKEYNKFGNGTMYDTYDNSILYNDYIIQQIYNHFSKIDNFNALIYISDHSEDIVNKLFNHSSSLFSWDMTKIPFYVFFSNNYIKNNKQIINTLKNRTKHPFTNDLLFDFLLGILNMKDNEFYIDKNDFSNDKWNHSVKDLTTLHGKKLLKEEKTDFISKYRNKFWLHRVNNPNIAKKFAKKYYGLEMDIIYYEKENDFENSHDKTDLKKYALYKTLDKYTYNRKHIWFDLKNLTANNKEKVERKLDYYFKKYNLSKDNCWIESKDFNSLDLFTKNDYNTSYCIPHYNFENMSEIDIEKIKKEIETISYSKKVKAISFDGKYYSFIKSLNLNPNISLLTWFNKKPLSDFQNNKELQKIIEDPQIKIVLVEEIDDNWR